MCVGGRVHSKTVLYTRCHRDRKETGHTLTIILYTVNQRKNLKYTIVTNKAPNQPHTRHTRLEDWVKGSQSEDTNICWATQQLVAGLHQHLESGGRDESRVTVSLCHLLILNMNTHYNTESTEKLKIYHRKSDKSEKSSKRRKFERNIYIKFSLGSKRSV